MKKWMCYYVSSTGTREGTEYVSAKTRGEAKRHYVHFFNISSYDKVVVIPVYEGES